MQNEIEHGRRIHADAERFWGWASPAGRLRAARRVRLLIEHGHIDAGTYLLEAGCGTGVFTAYLARTGARVEAIDVSPDLLNRARRRPGCEHVTFILGDVESGEGLQGPYDAVVGVSVLHHLDLPAALPRLLGVLKAGGRFVFSEPNLRNPQVWLTKNVGWIKRRLGDSPDETAFRRDRLAGILRDYGLAEISITPFDWLHPWTPAPLIPMASVAGSLLERIPLAREISGSLLIVANKPG